MGFIMKFKIHYLYQFNVDDLPDEAFLEGNFNELDFVELPDYVFVETPTSLTLSEAVKLVDNHPAICSKMKEIKGKVLSVDKVELVSEEF